MILHCHFGNENSFLSNFSKIAEVVIALANLFLAGYVLSYQKDKDKKSDNATARLNEQNIKLQWFKELIIQPNMMAINSFYDNLQTIRERITANDLTIAQKEEINNFIKAESARFRKSFIDVLFFVDKKFANQIMENMDSLIDGITNAIFNDELKLKLPDVYEKQIGSKISYSKNNLVAQLYNYKGIAE